MYHECHTYTQIARITRYHHQHSIVIQLRHLERVTMTVARAVCPWIILQTNPTTNKLFTLSTYSRSVLYHKTNVFISSTNTIKIRLFCPLQWHIGRTSTLYSYISFLQTSNIRQDLTSPHHSAVKFNCESQADEIWIFLYMKFLFPSHPIFI